MVTIIRRLRQAQLRDLLVFGEVLALVGIVCAWGFLRTGPNSTEDSEHELVYAIGDVAPGATVVRAVSISNTTSSPLEIKSLIPSCSCLTIGIDRQIIAPNEAATLKVEFPSPDHQGGFRHEVIIGFAGGQQPITLRLLGTVSAWINASPAAIEFGDTCPSDLKRQKLRLEVKELWPEAERKVTAQMST